MIYVFLYNALLLSVTSVSYKCARRYSMDCMDINLIGYSFIILKWTILRTEQISKWMGFIQVKWRKPLACVILCFIRQMTTACIGNGNLKCFNIMNQIWTITNYLWIWKKIKMIKGHIFGIENNFICKRYICE